jgi:glutathione S-transferase
LRPTDVSREETAMITTWNAKLSRSTRVLWLLEELGVPFELVPVEIARPDGSGGPDPANPHPLGQVPCIRDRGELIVESLAIWLHLSDVFPEAGMAPPAGHAKRAEYMGWMGLATAVFEPLVTAAMSGAPASERQAEARAFLDARFAEALARGPFLLWDRFSTVDLVYEPAPLLSGGVDSDRGDRRLAGRYCRTPRLGAREAG